MASDGPLQPTEILPRHAGPVQRRPAFGVALRRRIERLPSLLGSAGLTPASAAGIAVTATLATLRIAQMLSEQVRPSTPTGMGSALIVRGFAGAAITASGMRVEWTLVEVHRQLR